MMIINQGGFVWRCWTTLKDLVLDSKGIIFGGFVRDYILHDTAAIAYYQRQTDKNKEIQLANNDLVAHSDYDNENYEPDTIDRLLLPNDIDVMFHDRAALNDFEAKVRNSDCFTLYKKIEKNQQYFKGLPRSSQYSKWIIKVKVPPLMQSYLVNQPSFPLDIIVSNDEQQLPPLGACDFECNKMIMFQVHGQEIITMHNKYKFAGIRHDKHVQNVKSDIIKKKAKFISRDYCSWRLQKMLDKGFEIETDSMMVKVVGADDVCILCHMTIGDLFIKRKCCNAVYHPTCMEKIITKCDKCPSCRKMFSPFNSCIDISLCDNVGRLLSGINDDANTDDFREVLDVLGIPNTLLSD